MAEAAEHGHFQRSEHDRKYDRQMRLWGGHGQKRIEESHICVLGSGATASESLKNLVLPNIGEFTIVDSAKVTFQDLGNNFFVTQPQLNENRAEVVMKNMIEMNDSAKGNFLDRDVSDLINNEIDFFKKFNLVIATQLYGKDYETLAKFLYDNHIPLIAARTNGFLGYVRIATPELCIMESHPDDKRTDLYIHGPQLERFPELKEFLLQFSVTNPEHTGTIPAPSIIIQKLEEWKADHDGNLPANWDEKTEFKNWLVQGKMAHENWMQAQEYCALGYAPPRIGLDCKDVLNDPAGKELTPGCNLFWIMVRGLHDFMENEGNGCLPVSTAIPDLDTDSKTYVKLKEIYKQKSLQDRDLVAGYIRKRLAEQGKADNLIDDSYITLFVKHCRDLHIERYRTLDQEINSPDTDYVKEIFGEFDMSALEGGDDEEKPLKPKLINWYYAWRAVDEYYTQNGKLPGATDEEVESSAAALCTVCDAILEKQGIKGAELDNGEKLEVEKACLEEMARFGGCEPHVVAAFLGGCVSQAALKVILEQYYPFNHTMVYDGIHCQIQTFKV